MKRVKILEVDFQRQVLDLAQLKGWKSAHFRALMDRRGRWSTPVQGDGAGFPDLLLIKGERLIAAELKSDTGTVAPAQHEWLQAFRNAGAEVFVWRPADLDQIQEALS
ncbi:MAG: VRR-NUC domain-containing protein [Gemmatimonadaceae bacterium]|nr:VRR-NUC domain-containing protein [Gemmatimonadaceae bacterium]